MFKGTNASAGIGIGKAAIIKENELVIRPEKVIDGAACLLYTSHTWHGFALKQGNYDSYDTEKTQNTY